MDNVYFEAQKLEADAHSYLEKGEPEKAFDLFDKAGRLYRQLNSHQKAAFCYASAGTSWKIRCGERIYFNTASRYEAAAYQATVYYDYDYAAHLYKEAARYYQKDDFYMKFSQCSYLVNICRMNKNWLFVTNSKKLKQIPGKSYNYNISLYFRNLFDAVIGFFLYLLWGFGEKPYRAFMSAVFIILISAVIYCGGQIGYQDKVIIPSLFDSLYFSVITFTTLGYGDLHPLNNYRMVAIIEALSGLFIMPLYIVALSRKYLRTY